MNIEKYQKQREWLRRNEPQFRQRCLQCMQTGPNCYCHLVKKIELSFRFIILIHPIEARRRVATGRMSHLCLPNSLLLRGHDYSRHKMVNEILADPDNYSVVLSPGVNSGNLSLMSEAGRAGILPPGKKLNIFVLDGTWATAKKMLQESRNLRELPKICFTPPGPSHFRVRKQPGVNCYSTIEAIHYTIELLGPSFAFDTSKRTHDCLLNVFNYLVEQEIAVIRKANALAGPNRYQRGRGNIS
jgi:DTW domain-containing protein YfiP